MFIRDHKGHLVDIDETKFTNEKGTLFPFMVYTI